MKSLKICLCFCFLVIAFAGCKKESDQILSFDQLGVGSYIKLDSTIRSEFDFSNISSSAVQWIVSGKGEAISKIISYASTNNSADTSTWKMVKETPVTNNVATIFVTGHQLAAALGVADTALSPGNQYTIYNKVVTTSGKVYSLTNTNAELESAAAYNMALRLNATVTCPFNPAGFAGNFEVVSDNDWQDFNAGDIVQVTAAGPDSIALEAYPSPAYGTNRQPMIIKINPANGRATAKVQYIGDYYSGASTVAAKASLSSTKPSYVFSCTGDVLLYIDVLYGSTTYAAQYLRLRKM